MYILSFHSDIAGKIIITLQINHNKFFWMCIMRTLIVNDAVFFNLLHCYLMTVYDVFFFFWEQLIVFDWNINSLMIDYYNKLRTI